MAFRKPHRSAGPQEAAKSRPFLALLSNPKRWIDKWRWRLAVALVIQVAAGFLFQFAEHRYADTWPAQLLRKLSYELLHTQSGAPAADDEVVPDVEDAPVVVVDISRLRRMSPVGDNRPVWRDPLEITPRAQLLALLEQLATFKPAAIGFDIDLSREKSPSNWTAAARAEEKEFLEFAQTLTEGKREHFPAVYLGVARQWAQLLSPANEPSIFWHPGFRELAVTIAAAGEPHDGGPPAPSMLPLKQQLVVAGNAPLPEARGMAAALADAFRIRHKWEPRNPGTLFSASHEYRLGFPKQNGEMVSDYFFINYSGLKGLKKRTIDAEEFLKQAVDPARTEKLRAWIQNRVILVGAATREMTEDHIAIPGQRETQPGVFAHACGVESLLIRPFRSPSDWLELFAPGIISLLFGILLAVTLDPLHESTPWMRRWLIRSEAALELFKCALGMALYLAIALGLIRNGIVWAGALAALVGTVFESAVVVVVAWHVKPPAAHP